MKLLRTLVALDWRSAELTTALVAILFGVLVLVDPATYDRGASTVWLRSRDVPHWVFAAVVLAQGAVVAGMVLAGRVRPITAFVGAMFWMALAVMVWWGSGVGSSILIYLLFALINGWSFLLNRLGKVED